MLSPTAATVRLFLHIFAATIWVGGQVALAGVVPSLRKLGGSPATKAAANAFARVAWPAFAVLVATGIWNMVEVDFTQASSAYQATLMVKILLVALAGMFVAVHTVGKTKLALALGGALGALCSLAALFLGILLRTGS